MIRPLLALLAAVLLGPLSGAGAASDDLPARPAWDPETVELFGLLPVQEGGRIKPLDTLAGFQLLKTNGKRRVMLPSGERIEHTEWMLDCLFRPELARTYECFLVRNSEVLTAIGLSFADKKKSDRYSYDALRPGRDALFSKVSELSHKKASERNPVENGLVQLAINVRDFERLLSFFEFARVDFAVDPTPSLAEVFGETEHLGLSDVLAHATALSDVWRGMDSMEPQRRAEETAAARRIFGLIDHVSEQGGALALIPPPGDDDEWLAPVDLTGLAFGAAGTEVEDLSPQLAVLGSLEELAVSVDDPSAFREHLGEVHAELRGLASGIDEYERIPLEVALYRADFFYRALVAFLLSFLLVCGTWLLPGSKWLLRGVWASVLIGTGLLVVGIVVRCIIQHRPPVKTLYETILFVTACSVLVAFVIEWIDRQRIALAASTVLGALGMFLAMKFELKAAATDGDTMTSLVAVLDTNFWLATHVTTVTLGYAAGLLASALAHVWVVGKIFGLKAGDKTFYKSIVRMVYGVILFGLLFSVVGTVLGGIWANYSWGRFWGWDPKENGALLICLWELMILHARMGGYVRDHGLCILSILGGMVVAFSWWGVNLLEIGLHSYGFTSGVQLTLFVFYALEIAVVLASAVWWLGQRKLQAKV